MVDIAEKQERRHSPRRSNSTPESAGSTGSEWTWSAKIVEAVSGQSLEIYFRENIFEPLGMARHGLS